MISRFLSYLFIFAAKYKRTYNFSVKNVSKNTRNACRD